MNEKSKIILKNLITDVIPLIVYSILCLFKSKVLLNTLGSNVLGLYQLFVQLMKYLSLVEGGLGSAVIFSLYIGYDWLRAQEKVKTLDNALDCALDIYLDIIVVFLKLLKILSRNQEK